MRCLPMRQQQSCCRHAAQPYIPLWGPYIPSIDRKWMFRQIGSGYHYCQLVHGPLANFPHTKNSVLAVTTRRLELYNCSLIAALSLLLSHPCSSITTLSLLLLLSSLLSHLCALIAALFCCALIVALLLLLSSYCSLLAALLLLLSHCFSFFILTSFFLPLLAMLLLLLSHCFSSVTITAFLLPILAML